VVVLDGLAQLEGCAPLLIPPANKAPILALRKKIAGAGVPNTREGLRQYDLEMFAVYHDLIEPLLKNAGILSRKVATCSRLIEA